MKFRFLNILLVSALSFTLASCSDDDDFTDSIFPDVEELDPSSATYEFDLWLRDNFRVPYNMQVTYKMSYVNSDTDYNLVPTSVENSEKLMHLAKYLWFDVYDKLCGESFLKENGLRFIHLIGSSAINASQGTEILGTAEGGIKITLYKVNTLDPTNIDAMNEYYFKTMHHEFAHVLHQTKSYPKEYEQLTPGTYSPNYWQERTDAQANQMGYVTNYGSSQPREDFVEVIANYIVKTDAVWNAILDEAAKGTVGTSTGKEIILQKLDICRTWLADSYGMDLDALRAEVQKRQADLDMDKIMNDEY